jgi:predicted phage terminase large subunit-like protein
MSREEVYAAIQGELCRRSLWEFVKGAWHVHHQHIPLVENWHMRVICEHLEAVSRGDIINLLINIQPGLAKSLLVSVYWPAWEMAKFPHYQYLCVGAVDAVVLRDARRMHEVIDSPWYQQAFIPQWGWSKTQDAKGYYTNTAGGARMSRTVNQTITGLRGNRRIVDDPIDAADAHLGRVKMEQTCDWLGRAFSNRKNSPDDPLVMIMQRLAELDPAAWMLESEANVEHLMIPNEFDGETRYTSLGPYDPRGEVGDLVCPTLCDKQETDRLKRLLEDDYDGQYQQLPVPKSGVVFQEDHFDFWTDDTLPEFDRLVGSWDLNNLKRAMATKDTDPVAGHLWGAAGDDRYLLARYHGKIGLAATVEKIRRQVERWPDISKVLIEGKANGPSAVAMLSTDPGIARRLESIPVQGETKEQRALSALAGLRGRIYLPDPNEYPWVRLNFLPEVLGFPRKRHDDDVDAMTQALIWLMVSNKGGLWSATAG